MGLHRPPLEPLQSRYKTPECPPKTLPLFSILLCQIPTQLLLHMVQHVRVAARFLEVKILTFPDQFWTFSWPIMNFFLTWLLLETQPYMVSSFFPDKESGGFFPDKDLIDVFRPCLTVFIQFYSLTGHWPRKLWFEEIRVLSEKRKNLVSNIESQFIMQDT